MMELYKIERRIIMEYVKLNNGVEMPILGFGVYQIPKEQTKQCVLDALKVGYRAIDTAQSYFNEREVGEAIKESGIPREEIFVTSKVWIDNYGYEKCKKSVLESLDKMGLDYLDLMIIHSPEPWAEFRGEKRYFEENKEVWRALETAYKEGKVKAIGVSNFLKDDLENILSSCEIKPMVNQILTHVSNTKKELITFCKEHDILVEAYSPIAHGAALENEELQKMTQKYHVSVPQLCIRYVLELGLVALPKASTKEHIIDNAKVDFEISEDDMTVLKNMDTIENYGSDDFFPVFSGKNQKENQ